MAEIHIKDWFDLHVSKDPVSRGIMPHIKGKVYTPHDPFKLHHHSMYWTCWKRFSMFFDLYYLSLSNSPHKSTTVPFTLNWLTEITVGRINSVVSSLHLKWKDFIPFPLLFNSSVIYALIARKMGCPLLAKLSIMSWRMVSHSSWSLKTRIPHHFFSDSGLTIT